jgi:hypothetical protein
VKSSPRMTPKEALHLKSRLHQKSALCTRIPFVENPRSRRSASQVQIETLVTFCGMVWLRTMVLGRLERTPSIQERALCPAHRPPFTGRGPEQSPGPRCALLRLFSSSLPLIQCEAAHKVSQVG